MNVKLKSFEKFPGTLRDDGRASASENQSASNDLPADGAEWVDLFVREMTSAISVDDARIRASRMLGVLERSISGHASAEATHVIQKVYVYARLNQHTCMADGCTCHDSWVLGINPR